MVRGRLLQPFAQPRTDARQRNSQSPRRSEEIRNELVKGVAVCRPRPGFVFVLILTAANKNPASAPGFQPAFALQLPVSGAGGVGMQLEPPRQLAGAGQALSRSEVATQYP